MPLNEFIARSVSQYASISFFDSLRSTMPLYFFIGFFLFYIAGMIGFLSHATGAKWVLMFCGIILFVGWSWVKLYQYYEIKAPVKRKVFHYRLAQSLGGINLKPEISVSRKGIVSAQLDTGRNDHELKFRYTQNLWLNLGGIVPGTPVQTLRKIHPRTWFLEIRGETGVSGAKPVTYDFSARKDDDDRDDGYGVRLYDPKTHAPLPPKTDDPTKIAQQIRKAMDGTILKGTLTLNGGEFILLIFDNIEAIRRWRKPAVVYKNFQNSTRLAGLGVPPEQAAFYGISNLIDILKK